MPTTIPAITTQLHFTPAMTARVETLLAGRELAPFRYPIPDVLDACREVERQDGWSIVADEAEVFWLATRAGMVALQLAQVWEALQRCRSWHGRYQLTDVLEALLNVEGEGWGLSG
jgi:hypothetical protein